ncbi:putative P450 monooxygenase [Aureobasidium pullulans]|uniref:Bifunctional cytochrome P450/NADPH--P450 reductase n=1 Tax=Aureobasidium pullulans TaxID=5580 RepID=A0A4V4LFH3_AURPU|nr:putative P450 monooxygenase [Aureobasidium pullulans]
MRQFHNQQGLPFLGNVLSIDAAHPQESLANISQLYGMILDLARSILFKADCTGPIFKLKIGAERIFVASHELAKDLFDEEKFEKAVAGPLEEIRHGVKDGLFTAQPGEHNWEIAHRILMPAFGPLSIESMFNEMADVASQLVLKWARFGPDSAIDVTDDFTRLTLDSIALCAMGDRFNSFYHDDMHPFVKAMLGLLTGAGARARRPGFAPEMLYSKSNQQFHDDIDELQKVAKQLLDERRKNPTDKKDLLNAMIKGRDSKTGEQLPEEVIIRNMITFLIAGHETTSGLLSFLFYELLSNPEAYSSAQKEIDDVIGKQKITLELMSKLPYINACLRETLRLHPTAPGYKIKKGDVCVAVLPLIHRDATVYGEDAEAFKPERMLDEPFGKLPPHSWKPFGNGMRACIGRPFAWQEALLCVATLLQTFRFRLADPSYTLQIKTTLTIKPDNFHMKAELRDPDMIDELVGGIGASSTTGHKKQHKQHDTAEADPNAAPLLVLYGSNTGTCEALAQSLSSSAARHGYKAKVATMDSLASGMPKDIPAVIITASYEGQPPDNASHFCNWLEKADRKELEGVRYSVFGVGNKEWASTYQRIPTVVDSTLAEKGAERLADRFAADVTDGSDFDKFDKWQDEQFWPAMSKAFGEKGSSVEQSQSDASELKVEIDLQSRSNLLRQNMQVAEVRDTRLLTKPGVPRKRHIALNLPTGLTYKTGDYLAVLPHNPIENVRRVMRRLRLPWDATLKIEEGSATSLPTGIAIPVYDILSGMVELAQPATSRAVQIIAKTIPEETLSKELANRAGDESFQKNNISVLDILEEYPTAEFSIGQFLGAVSPMRVRQYSISSSPLEKVNVATLTWSVIDAPAKGRGEGRHFEGVSSNFLERLSPGDRVQISHRASRTGFGLPKDDESPIIIACAGTGLAPFRAFVAERALKKAAGKKVGAALLFYGLNAPDEDDMYREEFDAWEKAGVVDVRRAFTHASEKSCGARFVQDRIWHDRKDAIEMFKQNASLYLCGAGVVGTGIAEVMKKIRMEYHGCSEEEAAEWVSKLKGERYWADVFA